MLYLSALKDLMYEELYVDAKKKTYSKILYFFDIHEFVDVNQ